MLSSSCGSNKNGIEEDDLDPSDIAQEVHRTARGSESHYSVRRAALERVFAERESS
jgi:hypothetical protein